MLKKYIKKYGLPLVIIGGLGKLTSIICVFGIYGHWFSTLLPDESENITVYLDPEDTLEEYLITIEDVVVFGEMALNQAVFCPHGPLFVF